MSSIMKEALWINIDLSGANWHPSNRRWQIHCLKKNSPPKSQHYYYLLVLCHQNAVFRSIDKLYQYDSGMKFRGKKKINIIQHIQNGCKIFGQLPIWHFTTHFLHYNMAIQLAKNGGPTPTIIYPLFNRK